MLESRWFGLSIAVVDDDVRAAGNCDGVECCWDDNLLDDDISRRYTIDSMDELGGGGGWCRRNDRDRWCNSRLLSSDGVTVVFVREFRMFVRFQSSTDVDDIE